MRTVAVIVLCLALFLIFVGWLGYSSPEQLTRNQDSQTQSETASYKDKYSTALVALSLGFRRIGKFIIDYRDEIVAVGTFFVAAFTVVVALATAALYKATRDLVKGAEVTAERQLRAYVFPTQASLKNLNVGDVPEYRVDIQNSGQTPAYKLRHIDRFAFREFPLKGPLPEATASQNFTRTHLGPGRKLQKIGNAQRLDGTPLPIPAQAIEGLKAGTAAIYAYGVIDFVDAFKKSRWVKYRYMTGGNVGFRSDGKLIICEEGNETSED
jgi:hypothetical protein